MIVVAEAIITAYILFKYVQKRRKRLHSQNQNEIEMDRLLQTRSLTQVQLKEVETAVIHILMWKQELEGLNLHYRHSQHLNVEKEEEKEDVEEHGASNTKALMHADSTAVVSSQNI